LPRGQINILNRDDLEDCACESCRRCFCLSSNRLEPIGWEIGLFHTATKEDCMRIKLLVAVVGLAALATPSLAAEFYVVQDTTTKRCTIVEQRPTTQTMTIVGPGTAYTTRTEAEGAMKTVKVCESGGTVGGPVPPPAGR
jgi:hypothetical protein